MHWHYVCHQNANAPASTNVLSTLPDVMTKVKVVDMTPPIPNDTVSVRKWVPAALVGQIKEGLLAAAATNRP